MKWLLFLFASIALAQHQIQLTSNNVDCKNDTACNNKLANCLCTLQVFRASCVSIGNCPTTDNSGAFTQLPASGLSSVVNASSGTAWTYNDTDAALVNGSVWVYYERALWSAPNTLPPGAISNPVSIAIPVPAPHQATLNYSNSSCTTTQNCWIQLRRAVCTSPISCPSYETNPNVFTIPPDAALSFPVWNTTASGTTWQIIDKDANLADGTTYVYVSTVCYSASCVYSAASQPWIGTTLVGKKKKGKGLK